MALRLTLSLPDDARLALARLARRERRSVRGQAEVLLLRALNMWPEEAPQEQKGVKSDGDD